MFKTIRNDIRNSQFGATFRKESKEIKDFYLTGTQREELARMKAAKQIFYYSGWVLKAMFLKLTPVRRLLVIIGILPLFVIRFGDETNVQGNIFLGTFMLVLVIMLELKDKLLAHDELQEGKHIQELLMPERTPHVDGWSLYLFTRSANEVCGDLIDFLRLEKPKAAVAIADVAGKGLHAALLTAKLQATIRAFAFDEPSLTALMARINSIFHRDSPAHMFASLFYAEFSEESGIIRFVNAGHLPALVVQQGTVHELEKGEPALGLMRTVEYTEHTVTLNAGEWLMLYSDGITEAKNEQGEFYTKERLIKALHSSSSSSPEQIGQMIVADIDRFAGALSPSDDLSFIILKRR
ncbi:MAG: PP2C family protein-serine/threonine phosphatase [Bacteroidota bacterium]|nr:PP2C family protein-serine/threonine phosphatase [Bacteroidota bacterium]